MTERVTVSIRVNNDLELPVLVELAQVAERHGFDQLWVSNDLFLRSGPVLLGVLATTTTRIRIGAGVWNPYTLHPAEIAMMAATLQEASDGRFLLGLGAGAAEFLGWAGIERTRPLSVTRDAILAVRALQAGGTPAVDGWTSGARLRPPPARPAPVYVGAMSPRMLAMAGAHADGVLPLLFPPESFDAAVAHIAEGASSAGRSLDELDVPACFWCSVDEDQDAARRALAEKLAYYGASFAPALLARSGLSVADFAPLQAAATAGDLEGAVAMVTPSMLNLGVTGTAADVAVRCHALRNAGATHLSFGPPLGPDPVSAVAYLGSAVLPLIGR